MPAMLPTTGAAGLGPLAGVGGGGVGGTGGTGTGGVGCVVGGGVGGAGGVGAGGGFGGGVGSGVALHAAWQAFMVCVPVASAVHLPAVLSQEAICSHVLEHAALVWPTAL